MQIRRFTLFVVCSSVLAGCGGDAGPVSPAGSALVLSFTGLRGLNAATEGTYEAWASPNGTFRSLGRFTDTTSVTVTPGAMSDGTEIWITVERPGDNDALPSAQKLLHGTLHGGRADLSVAGALTIANVPLREHPGQFTMFSPSDNALHGYPSFEESGVWLFNMQPRLTEQGDMWVRLAVLDGGWTYEGWMVRDVGQPGAIWLSYGKFTPDYTGAVNSRDDTGWGPYSGVTNFRADGEEEFPGDDWISNPLNFTLPAGLTLPLNLREKAANGSLRWTHVITIEPAWNKGEAIGAERPFVVRPYEDPFGTADPGMPRTITFHAENVPSGRAELH
jgi:hypothetical protein